MASINLFCIRSFLFSSHQNTQTNTYMPPSSCNHHLSLLSPSKRLAGQSQENHQSNQNHQSIDPSSSSSDQEQRQVTPRIATHINNHNNTINNNTQKNKLNVNDQQISGLEVAATAVIEEPAASEQNNNSQLPTTTTTSSATTTPQRVCHRYHPVSRKGTEFISQQVPGFRSFGSNNRYITQRNK